MNADAINKVTKALKKLLDDALQPLNNAPETVLVGPLDDPQNDNFKVLLFLYRVAVNADLRSTKHTAFGLSSQPPTIYEGSLPLDLYYLITAGNRNSGGELTDLSLLGRVMQLLNDTPFLAGADLQHEVVRITLDPVGSEEMSRIWTLFPTANYRTSVVYLLSPVWIDPALPRTTGTPVVEEPHVVGQVGA
jgi:hypothetical protein